MRKPRNLFVCVSEEREDRERGEREGEGTQALSLSSGTHRIHNSLAEHAGRFPLVELREPRNLCVCVSEDLGHGEGAGAHATMLTDTICDSPNSNESDVVSYESIKRELKIRSIHECRCDERLQIKRSNLHASHNLV